MAKDQKMKGKRKLTRAQRKASKASVVARPATRAAETLARGAKVCAKCKVELPVSDFGADARRGDGRASWCRTCGAAAQRERYAANPEKARERTRARYADPVKGEQIRAAVRERYAANPEPAKAAMRARKVDLKARGLCTDCGAVPTVGGKVNCESCARKMAERHLVRKYGLDFAARAALLRERDART